MQEKEFYRVGGTDTIRVDVRFVAATNRDLVEEVRNGNFRKDLFYRLNVFPIRIPALRKRKGDIPALAEHFLGRFARQRGLGKAPVLEKKALDLLLSYSWPGNVRELENVIERAVILSEGDALTADLLPLEVTRPRDGEHPFGELADLTLRGAREKVEEMYFRRILGNFQGNVSRAAKHAGIGRGTFHEKLRKLGIDPTEFRKALDPSPPESP
jgi:DNA-binding NtrC family response regulator